MTTIQNERDWNKLWAFRAACRPSTVQVPVAEGSPLARAAARLAAKTAGTGAGTAQAPPATPAAGDPLTRAIERLSATPAPQEVSGPEGSLIVKVCEAAAARAVTARSTEPRGDRLGAT
jgi:hypothetical protein